jgi:hypothetical protein
MAAIRSLLLKSLCEKHEPKHLLFQLFLLLRTCTYAPKLSSAGVYEG